jgi:hypothetical protein
MSLLSLPPCLPVNEDRLEGHCAGIFPRLFAYREREAPSTIDQMTLLLSNKK